MYGVPELIWLQFSSYGYLESSGFCYGNPFFSAKLVVDSSSYDLRSEIHMPMYLKNSILCFVGVQFFNAEY